MASSQRLSAYYDFVMAVGGKWIIYYHHVITLLALLLSFK